MSKNSKKVGSRLAMKASAILAASALVLSPLQASAALLDLGGVVGTATGLVGGVVGTATGVVGSVAQNPVGTVVGTAGAVADTVNGVAGDVAATGSALTGNGLDIQIPAVGNVEVLKDGGLVEANVLSPEDNGDAGKSGLVNAGVGLNHQLASSVAKVDPSTGSLVLTYNTGGLVNLDVLKDLKVVFQMPEEFASLLTKDSFKQGLSATYDYPTLSVLDIDVLETLGLDILGTDGSYSSDELTIDPATNTISMNVKGLLAVNALSTQQSSLEVNLTVPMNELPCALDNEYTFKAFASEALIDVAVLEKYSADVNVAVEYGEDNPCVKDEPKTPGTPGTPGTPNTPGETPTPGDKLPVTATNIGNWALAGLVVLLAGLATRFLSRKSA